jgi:hypothetical protein
MNYATQVSYDFDSDDMVNNLDDVAENFRCPMNW